ncbi:dethiobiotin synthase [Thiolapillus brandeum]|uniref:ATP-dependent dethiobiotin synthetase BioD n=1 Tax=Thiolapillus brandeum TaxID=1076588 RepID=A0A7U6JIK7_9GAMM|nr:dethiobiotin synthase [Thiolapillus brandeum]BAO44962.1 dithiobiotin synthetase [Thiolapillus brandeum]
MRYFITGTDTDCGKTLVTLGFMQLCQERGLTTAGMKPVAAGALRTREGLLNSDALAIQEQCCPSLDYAAVNPYCFEPGVAPHLAAAMAGTRIDLSVLEKRYQALAQSHQAVVVEGAGGWKVPLNEDQDSADLCRRLGLPVVLVVGLRLGCINHSLLSVESIQASGVTLLGWVANHIDANMALAEDNIQTLKGRIKAPLLGRIPRLDNPTAATVSTYLSLPVAATEC